MKSFYNRLFLFILFRKIFLHNRQQTGEDKVGINRFEEVFEMDFQNQVVLITGGAGGIGKAAAKKFAEHGANLALVDLEQEALEKAASEIKTEKEILLLTADVTKEEDVKKYVDATVKKWGRIDVFLNNAGVEGKFGLITELSAQDLDFVLGVNVKGVFLGLKHVMSVMMEQGKGSIVNTASVAGLIGSPGMAPYIASKHAVIGLTKTAALELAESGVRVNAVCPAPIHTRMMRSIEAGAMPGKEEEAQAAFAEAVPMKRYGEPEEVANLMLFLASEQASYLTGCYYRVDGGYGATSA